MAPATRAHSIRLGRVVVYRGNEPSSPGKRQRQRPHESRGKGMGVDDLGLQGAQRSAYLESANRRA